MAMMMEVLMTITLVIAFFFVLFLLCSWCCKRKRQGTVFGPSGAPITVSNQPVNASPMVIPPYPLDSHAMPQPIHPQVPVGMPGAGYQTAYPPAPAPGFYSLPGFPQMGTGFQGVYPDGGYPPGTPGGPYPPQSAPPPSYNEAMAQPPVAPTVINEGYVKQSPYNPNY